MSFNLSISLDSKNHNLVAKFWIGLMDAKLKTQDQYSSQLELNPYLNLRITNVPEIKKVKNRMHLDIKVSDMEESKLKIINLGGRLLEMKQSGDFLWLIMADVEGNEFCIYK